MAHAIVMIKACTNRNNRKLEGYIHSSICSRSVPVGRQVGLQAGRLAGENVILFKLLTVL